VTVRPGYGPRKTSDATAPARDRDASGDGTGLQRPAAAPTLADRASTWRPLADDGLDRQLRCAAGSPRSGGAGVGAWPRSEWGIAEPDRSGRDREGVRTSSMRPSPPGRSTQARSAARPGPPARATAACLERLNVIGVVGDRHQTAPSRGKAATSRSGGKAFSAAARHPRAPAPEEPRFHFARRRCRTPAGRSGVTVSAKAGVPRSEGPRNRLVPVR